MVLPTLQLSPGLLMELFDLLEDLKLQQYYGEIFANPVDYVGPPVLENYLQVVSRPLDYTTMQVHLNHREYEYLYQFIHDLAVIYDNCRRYNTGVAFFQKAADQAEIYAINTMQRITELKGINMEFYLKYSRMFLKQFQKVQKGASSGRIRSVYLLLKKLKKTQIDAIFGQKDIKIDFQNCEEIEIKILSIIK
ncbi:Bromodomain-containing protein [Spironucleus salmonicida]|uniref:Bromodomain-containing protein n=1 Tax=Spironucleus salmonicida TaxID=348837 RepID=V6LCL6_9EUKA|nr:Bromodomain-containing protein [Spironucleus salmonicida]|eukprot:EST42187.1 Bromodomain-containing protein [Spironucleus salmonicida]